jgi:GNAT superfamily N-acetyltransferase
MPMEISMFCPSLDDIPAYDVPDGYTMRAYQTGDIQHWLAFHIPLFDEGVINKNLFWREYGRDESILKSRQFYMIHGEQVMGSISAWFGSEERGTHLGRIHWVVLREDYRGKGLAKPLLSFACDMLKQLDHKQAYLTTDTDLFPAISLYLKFGFQPEINLDQDKHTWDDVYRHLNL